MLYTKNSAHDSIYYSYNYYADLKFSHKSVSLWLTSVRNMYLRLFQRTFWDTAGTTEWDWSRRYLN